MTKHESPRGPDGETLCEWCGGPVKQAGVGRRKRYCKAGHREMAYRARKVEDRIATAVRIDRALRDDRRPVSSTDVSSGRPESSVDETRKPPVSSVDETVPAGRKPDGAPRPRLLPPPPGAKREPGTFAGGIGMMPMLPLTEDADGE